MMSQEIIYNYNKQLELYKNIIKQTCLLLGHNEIVVPEVTKHLLGEFKTPKILKDKNRPKHRRNNYQIFSNEVREKIKLSLEDKSPKNVSIEISKCWSQLSSDEKEIYNKKSKEDSVRFEQEMDFYKDQQMEMKRNFLENIRKLENRELIDENALMKEKNLKSVNPMNKEFLEEVSKEEVDTKTFKREDPKKKEFLEVSEVKEVVTKTIKRKDSKK